MKGSVFVGFSQFIEENYGLHIWQQLIDECCLKEQGVYLSTEIYEEQDFPILLSKLSKIINKSVMEIERDFGIAFFDTLLTLAKHHIENIDNLFQFLRAVDSVIHIEVKKSDSQAYTPTLLYDQPSENTLIIRYLSKRKMCFFAEGLIAGAANYFNTPVNIVQTECIHCGDQHCLIQVEI
jgi:predicted hydrocarbon binding protein